MPYIAAADSVAIIAHQDFVVDDSGEYSCNETEGLANSAGYGCEHCGEYFHEADMYYIGSEFYCSEECVEEEGYVRCVDTEEFHNIDDCYFCVSDDNWYYCDTRLTEVDGEWYHDSDEDIVYSEHSDEYFHSSNCTYMDCVDDWIHNDDVDDVLAENEEEDEDEDAQAPEERINVTSTLTGRWSSYHTIVHSGSST